MRVGVGYGDSPDTVTAGKMAIQAAIGSAGIERQCDMVLLFGTARHNQQVLRQVVRTEIGPEVPVYGGGAVGIITNDSFGYAGDQVGVACVWLEESSCEVVTESGLVESEEETGKRLGKKLAAIGTEEDSPVVLFYDAVDQSRGDTRLLMATWLLQGLEEGLGFLPDLVGAGLQGDHVSTPTQQYIGESLGQGETIAMKFGNMRLDSVIMHGCRPASPYYTVTKAEGPVILEINNEPALEFVDKVLDAAIAPEEYPFFLLFGLNHGDRWGEYDEDNYASRLCLGIDKERGGIVMFEPDMVAGTQFQIMFRSLDLDYMQPKIDRLFGEIDDAEPVFAIYIDCAGRCAGYGGLDIEDAVIIQEAVGDRIPLLGLYTGVEIASMGGKPRGLDWTGVFCIFSEKTGTETQGRKQKGQNWEADSDSDQEEEMPFDVASSIIEQNIAKILQLDTRSIAIRHELEHKRRGFALLAELSVSLRQATDYKDVFVPVTQRINSALNMQKTVVLLPGEEGGFVPRVMQGYTDEEKKRISGLCLDVDDEMLDPDTAVIVNGSDNPERFEEIRTVLDLPFFVSTPIIVKNDIVAVLMTGRMSEQPPFLSRLGVSDFETIQAIGALLSTVLVYQRLDAANKLAQSDVLTGLFNRGAFELQVTDLLDEGLVRGQMFAFLMIDFDLFKDVNDSYGHIQGDEALRALADVLRSSFRSTDLVARLGGDEFEVFCTVSGVEQITKKIEGLLEKWRTTPLETGDGNTFYGTLSIGLSLAPHDGKTYKELYHKADIAMYHSKQNGRDRLTVFNATEMGSEV